jgi:hypothetical protein
MPRKPIPGFSRSDKVIRPVARPPRPPLAGMLSSIGVLVAILISLQVYGRFQIAKVLDFGATLHEACAVNDHAVRPDNFDKMRLSLGALGPMLQPLANDTNNVKLKTAYECMTRGRLVFEVILDRGNTPISVMVVKRERGDSFPRALGSDVDTSTSARINQGKAQGYSVDGFVSGNYISWVVSALSASDNLALSRTIAPVVMRYTQAGAR